MNWFSCGEISIANGAVEVKIGGGVKYQDSSNERSAGTLSDASVSESSPDEAGELLGTISIDCETTSRQTAGLDVLPIDGKLFLLRCLLKFLLLPPFFISATVCSASESFLGRLSSSTKIL